VDGNPQGSVAFDPKSQDALLLPDFGGAMGPGEHKVQLVMADGSEMPFSLEVRYHSEKPADSSDCKLTLSTALSNAKVTEGTITEAKVKVANKSQDALPMPVAIIGIPGGLEVRHDQLKELVKSKTVDAYEVRGRDVVLYWRAFKPGQSVDLALSLVAAIPGTYEGPAARAYQYYADEFKTWNPGLKAEITPR
jgi:hypothetical protein